MNLQKRIINFIKRIFIFTILLMLCSFFTISFFSSIFHAALFLLLYLIVIVFFLFFTFPVIKLPVPSGNLFVGVKPCHLIDKKRESKIAGNRELLAYIWFPTDQKNKNKKGFYLPELIMLNQQKIFQEILKINTHTINNANKLSNAFESYPIIIVSHGLGSLSNFSMAQIQELVSHGYIVVGVNHTNFCYLTIFPDGRTISFDNEKFDIPIEKFIQDEDNLINVFEKEVETCVEDISFIIDSLEELNIDKNSIFYKRLNLESIGILGHSIGGSIAAEACRVDSRCKAGISLDGSIIEKTIENKFSKPFMFILGYLLNENENLIDRRIRNFKINNENIKIFNKKRDYIRKICNHIGKDSYYITLKNASHFAFTDFTLASPILKLYLDYYIGAEHGSNFANQINNNVLNFFDKYLKGKDLQL